MTRKRILYLILTGISALLFAFYVNAYFSEEGIHQSMVDSYNKTYPDEKITINAPDTQKIIKENEQTYGIYAFCFLSLTLLNYYLANKDKKKDDYPSK